MRSRNRRLPSGWYPRTASEIEELLALWRKDSVEPGALAAVAPHAGWAFSGRLAARALASLGPAETLAVVGGHLPSGYPVLVAREEVYETPLGSLAQDAPLAAELGRLLDLDEDGSDDNTVEIQLPLIKALRPETKILWLRAPAGPASIELGACLDTAARRLGRSLVCLGSTDLTHYGPDYGFEPAGRGEKALAWVREVSDKGFIDALLARDAPAVLARGGAGSACSAGAAAAALAFALARGADRALLLGYSTSLELRRAESFVGYCALGFYPA
jgi:AmmeMemoRadiSam system protein B